jgi:hypothetical protein
MSSDLGTIFGSGGLVISIISMVYAAINHKRIRAKCCGRNLDFEINIDSTEEKDKEAKHSEKEESNDTKPKKKTAKVVPELELPARPASAINVKPYAERRWIEDDDADKELEDDEELGLGKGETTGGQYEIRTRA